MLAIIERIAYAVTRGAIKAIWEELRKPRTAVDEEVTDEDRIIEDRLRGRLLAHLGGLPSDADGHTGPDDSAPTDAEDQGAGVA